MADFRERVLLHIKSIIPKLIADSVFITDQKVHLLDKIIL